MPFTFKLARRLALTYAVLLLSSAASGCQPEAVTGPAVAVASVEISPSSLTIQVGENRQLVAIVRDEAGRDVLDGRMITWSTEDSALVQVGADGMVRAVQEGSVGITATAEGRRGWGWIKVFRAPVASVTISPADARISVGDTLQLTATLQDARGTTLSGRAVAWASSAPAIASVGPGGLVTAVTSGSATITASSEGKSGMAGITVATIPVASVTLTPASASLQVGATLQLSAVIRDSAGNVLSGRAVSWSTSTPSVASVSSGGLVAGISSGTATITATAEGQSGVGVATVQESTGLNPACPAFSAPAVPAPLRTFYVLADNGNDAADGLTPQAAWRTLAKANAVAQPGDLFLLGGTFSNENLRPSVSGTATRKIVYRAALPGSARMVGGKYDAAVWLDGRSHVVVEGVEITAVPYPLLLRSGASEVWIRNVYVHDTGSGIIISQSSDNRLEDSRLERIGSEASNTGDAVFIQNGAHRNTIVRNRVGPAGHGTIWVSYQGATEATANENVIAHNTTFNPWASGMGLNGKATGTIVECNRIYGAADGKGINYARSGIELEGSGNAIRFNEIYTNGAFGITIQGRTFNGFRQDAIGNHVYHNTVFSNGNASLQIVQKDAGLVQSNVIENNLFWQDAGFPFGDQRYSIAVDLYNADGVNVWGPGQLGGNIVRNNIFPSNQLLVLMIRTAGAGGNTSYSLSQAQSALAGWEMNQQVNPLFENAAQQDFRLQAGSPAVDIGRLIAGHGFRGAAPDLGAWER